MHIFYTPDIKSLIYTLSPQESKHCVKVMRLSEGDKLMLLDGEGSIYIAELVIGNAKSCVVNVIETIKKKRNPTHLHIAIAPTKNMDRIETFVEKAVELGVSEITLLLCENSERKVVKQERIERIAIAALKQSQQAFMPKINSLIKFGDFLKKENLSDRFVAYCGDEKKISIQDALKKASKATILIGPEGDFSPKEIDSALKENYKPISLGESRLRTETAGIYCCSVFRCINF